MKKRLAEALANYFHSFNGAQQFLSFKVAHLCKAAIGSPSTQDVSKVFHVWHPVLRRLIASPPLINSILKLLAILQW